MHGLTVERDHHGAGEYTHTPAVLTLSLTLGSSLTLEQIADGRRWLGRSARGSINVMPAGLPRTFRHRDGCTFACVTIPEPADTQLRPLLAVRDEPLRLLLEAVLAEHEDGATTRLFRDAIAQAIVARLVALDGRRTEETARGLPPVAIARVVELMRAHLADDLSVDDIARAANLSAAHFSTLFRVSFGEPPHHHLIRLRVERATALVEQGMDPASAASAVGFYDQSHLARHMRRLLGVTPGMIARARRSAKDRPAHRTNVRDGR
jgi:AraC family transcriptional regulator